MRKIEFISYTGKWPSLCCGTLTITVDGKEYSSKCALISGGHCYVEDNYENFLVETGEWSVDLDKTMSPQIEFTDEEKKYITNLINYNVEYGCCGGCT